MSARERLEMADETPRDVVESSGSRPLASVLRKS